jgi:hypothetical protein
MLPILRSSVLLLLAACRAPMARRLRQLRHVMVAGLLCTVVCIGVVPARGHVPARPDRDITVANLNILHGFACDPPVPGDGDQCCSSSTLWPRAVPIS